MSLFDKLLGLKLVSEEDVTDTTWWEQSVLQGLAQDGPDDQAEKEKSGPKSTLRPGSLN